MADKKAYNEACENLNFQLQNKRATLNLINDQWNEANEKRRELHKTASEIEISINDGSLTYGEAATRMDAIRLLLKNVGNNLYLNGLYFLDDYKDQKTRNIELFMTSAKYRSAWRNETNKIIREKYAYLIGNKQDLLNECRATPCRFFNNGKCRNLECKHKHVCSECYHILKKIANHVFSPDCPIYLIRRKEFGKRIEKVTKKDYCSDSSDSIGPERKRRKIAARSPSSTSTSSSSSVSSAAPSTTYKKTNRPELVKKSTKKSTT